MTLGKVLDNLLKQTTSPNHRSIKVGGTLIIEVQGSDKGYLEAAVYSGNYPLIVRVDGMKGNQNDIETLHLDIQDGKVEIPLYHLFVEGGNPINFPPGPYSYWIESAANVNDQVPMFKEVFFDIIP